MSFSPSKSKPQPLDKLHQQLISHILKKSPSPLVSQTLNLYAETLIKQDKTTRQHFDLCCQLGFYELLQDMFNNNNYELQVLQTISLLLINLQHPESIAYLLSHNLIAEIITDSKNTKQESLEYYISFLKTLSLKLNPSNLALFYNEKYYRFPLAEIASSYYNHPESLIRTSSMSIIFNLMQIPSLPLTHYFTSFPFSLLFPHLVCYLKSKWLEIDQEFIHSTSQTRTQELLEDQKDYVMLLHDIMRLGGCEGIRAIIENCIVVYLIKPILKSLLFVGKSEVSMVLGLYLLLDYLVVFQEEKEIVEFVGGCLFGDGLGEDVEKRMEEETYVPKSYCFEKTGGVGGLRERFGEEMDLLYKDLWKKQGKSKGKEDTLQTQPPREIHPDLLQELSKITQTIGYNLLLREKDPSFWFYNIPNSTSHHPTSQKLHPNPIKQIVYSLLKTKDDLMLQLVTKIILFFSTNKYISQRKLMECQIMLYGGEGKEKMEISPGETEEEKEERERLEEKNLDNIKMLTVTYLSYLSSEMLFRTPTLQCIFSFLNLLLPRPSNTLSPQQSQLLLSCFSRTLLDLRKLCKTSSKTLITHSLQKTLLHPHPPSPSPLPTFSSLQIQLDNPETTIHQLLLTFHHLLLLRYKHLPSKKSHSLSQLPLHYTQQFTNSSTHWHPNSSIEIQNRNLIQCYNKTTKTKSIIVNDRLNFILVKEKESQTEVVVLVNSGYKYLEVGEQGGEGNALVVKVKGGRMYELEFENQYLMKEVARKVREARENCVNEEIVFLLGWIQECMSDL